MPDNIEYCDFLIVGGGIAGLSATIAAAKYGKVIILTKGKIGETATEKAQGGIAAAIDQIRDSTQFHFEDTIEAGAGLCDEAAVRVLVTEGVDRVKELIEYGAQFDRAETEGEPGFALALEGAHKRRRILHAGDATGEEIQRTLGSKVLSEKLAEVYPFVLGTELIIKDGRCLGIKALDIRDNSVKYYLAQATLLSTGGLGQVYLYTTNPEVATGDGVAMAYQAGATVTDMEFVQFHPTSLVQSAELKDIVALPRFLISEAVRGEGATLLNSRGERFMQKYDVKGELAPRDIVARAIFQEMKETGSDHVSLRLAQLDPETIRRRFPVIYKTCLERGLDITKDNIPVAPAAHYFMGGIKTDVNGKTDIASLYAAGECAALGVHGANRLASNSLLDGLVFGHRAALTAKNETQAVGNFSFDSNPLGQTNLSADKIQRLKLTIKSCMWNEVGIVRSADSLLRSFKIMQDLSRQLTFSAASKDEIELKNMHLVAWLITRAAFDRKESRGAHYRSDFPTHSDVDWQRHLVYKKG